MRPAFLDNAARRGIEHAACVDAIVASIAGLLALAGLLFASMPA